MYLARRKPLDLNSNVQVLTQVRSYKNSDWIDKYVRIYSAFSTFTCWNLLSTCWNYWVPIKAQKVQPPTTPATTRFHFAVSGKKCLYTGRILHSLIPNQRVMAGDETAASCNSSGNTWSYWSFSWLAHWAGQLTNIMPNGGIFISVFCRDL